MGNVGIFWEISKKFPGNFRKIFGKFSGKDKVIRKWEIKILKRQNNFSMNGLSENNSTIMLNSFFKYLRICNFCQICRFFPTTFTYIHTYIHTYLLTYITNTHAYITYIQTYIHTYIAYIHASINTFIHTCTHMNM